MGEGPRGPLTSGVLGARLSAEAGRLLSLLRQPCWRRKWVPDTGFITRIGAFPWSFTGLCSGESARGSARMFAYLPPSTLRVCPVIQEEKSEEKKRVAKAMSSAFPSLRVAMESTRRFWPSSP